MVKTCCIKECGEPSIARGLCRSHYNKLPEVKQKQKEYRESSKGKEVAKKKAEKYRKSKKNKETQLRYRRSEKGRDKNRERSHLRRLKIENIKAERISSLKVFERDKWICKLCWQPVDKTLSFPNPESASLDHILPLSMGGTHTYTNVQLSHLKCNRIKYNKT